MKQKFLFPIIFIVLFLFSLKVMATIQPDLETESILLMDASTGEIIYEKAGDKPMYPASTTKILTALLAIELGNLKDVITIGTEVLAIPPNSSKAGHIPGEMILLEDLLMGLMLPSGNDSAISIACYIAKKQTQNSTLAVSEALDYFSKLCNERAKEIGAYQTHFINPHGYHDEEHYTTALDLALITKEAMKNLSFQKIVQVPSYTVETNKSKRLWENTNLLLDSEKVEVFYPYATGTKTGFTTPAGECLVATANKEGAELILVLLNSPKNQRWEEAKQLFEYGFETLKIDDETKNKSIESVEKIKNIEVVDLKSFDAIKDVAQKILMKYINKIKAVGGFFLFLFILKNILDIAKYTVRKN